MRHQPPERVHLRREIERTRGAGVEEDEQARDRIGRGLGDGRDACDHQILVAQARRRAAGDGERHLEVGLGRDVALVHGQLALARVHLHLELVDERQPGQQHAVGRARARQLLRIGEDDLLVARRGDGKNARVELIARLLLEQRRVLAPVQEILVGATRRLQLDDFALLPAPALSHGEAAHRGARRQRDRELALDRARLGIVEDEVQLGEGERIFDDGAGAEGDDAQARAVGGGERERCAGAARRGRRVGRRDGGPGVGGDVARRRHRRRVVDGRRALLAETAGEGGDDGEAGQGAQHHPSRAEG